MPQFTVDEDLAALVEQLAKPKPFENLSFNAALRRVLTQYVDELEMLGAESMLLARNAPKKALSPSPEQWVASVPELQNQKALTSWKAICDFLKINTGGDSARRKLKNWVKANRPAWPEVPSITAD
jgi:hypothetical protein